MRLVIRLLATVSVLAVVGCSNDGDTSAPVTTADVDGAARVRVSDRNEPGSAEGLGSIPELDAIALRCQEGDMAACDELYREVAQYARYGATCGERFDEVDAWCTELGDVDDPGTGEPPGPADLPEPTSAEGLGDDPALDALASACHDGDMAACDQLYWTSAVDSAYEDYGGTCGGRFEFAPGHCEERTAGSAEDSTTTTSTTTTTSVDDGPGGNLDGKFRCIVFVNPAAGQFTVTRQFSLDSAGTYQEFEPTGQTQRGSGPYVVEAGTGWLDFREGPLDTAFARPRPDGGWWLTSEDLRDATEFDQDRNSEVCRPV